MEAEACYLDAKSVLKSLQADPKNGLGSEKIPRLLKVHGYNTIPKPKEKSFAALIMEQFEDLLVLILLSSAAISFILGCLETDATLFEAFIEPVVIMLILIANAIVGVWQETNAANALEKLKEFESKTTSAVRDGKVVTVDSKQLVPGDLIRLCVGERIPADCRLIQISSAGYFMCNESMLTGETISKNKTIDTIKRKGHIVVQDMTNMLFSGSLVVKGRCIAVVVKTGADTELGKIHCQLSQLDAEKSRTPLQSRLDLFASQLSKIILFVCILVWIINIRHFTDPEHGNFFNGAVYYFKIAITLAVAAIPEGLPAVVTTCLALGTTRMAKKNAIVRALPSIETLGCTTVICCDKTGTLTTNQMTLQSILVCDDVIDDKLSIDEYKIKQNNLSNDRSLPKTTIKCVSGKDKNIETPLKISPFKKILEIGAFCNESTLIEKFSPKRHYITTGMPIEIALLKTAHLFQTIPDKTQTRRLLFCDFDRKRKLMSTIDIINDSSDTQPICHVKGAPEYVLTRCTHYLSSSNEIIELDDTSREIIFKSIVLMAENNGQRLLSMAYKPMEMKKISFEKEETLMNNSEEILDNRLEEFNKKIGFVNGRIVTESDGFYPHEKGLIFVGVVGLLDPPRLEVKKALEKCRLAGITVKVITGDHKSTAEFVCKQIGLFEGLNEKEIGDRSITGNAFTQLSAEKQVSVAEKAILFSRVEPSHKLNLVRILKAQNHVVAMTGDGVNDASALRCADIGIAMGSGTEVARQASDIILADDNFVTIVSAIEEGRAIYSNTKQFIRYLISSNIGEVVSIFLVALLGIPEILIPVQLLWVNLVTDGLPATALGFNLPEKNSMTISPRKRDDKLISGWLLFRYTVVGVYIGVVTVVGFIYWYTLYENGPKLSFTELQNYHLCNETKINDYKMEGFNETRPVNCLVFRDKKASTISLSILVTVEMFNAFNALSESESLLVVTLMTNLYVVGATVLSFVLHFMILYVPFLRSIFETSALSFGEWKIVIGLSLPVVLVDEVLKLWQRRVLL